MKTVGLFFGSFNPIHYGHIMTANYCIEEYDLDEVWFVIAAHNPFKESKSLASFEHRVNMTQIAIEENPKMKVEDIEISLNEPFYTDKTIKALKEKYSNIEFVIILGIDNWMILDSWHNCKDILTNRIIVLPRGNNDDLNKFVNKKNKLQDLFYDNRLVIFTNSRFASKCPNCNLSASFIRYSISNKKSIFGYTPFNVIKYINESKIYE